jgi:pre-mRNA-splicing factor RBM22/SLT11
MAASLQSTAISDVNRSYALMTAEAKQAAEGGIVPFTGLAATIPAAHAELMALGRNKPHYERNAPKLCTFFARGECTRGIECPYRHELPSNTDKPFSRQNYKDRYVVLLACDQGCGKPDVSVR